MPKVSVIIPVYNVEPYLRQALDSVVNQTLSDIEIICVDDCSTDNSLNILKEYASKDSRFVVVEQDENQGACTARNKGLKTAQGEYIMLLDPDDWYELDACEVAYNQIKKNNNDIVLFANNEFIENDGTCKYDNSRIEPFGEYIDCPNIMLDDVNCFYLTSMWHQYAIYRRTLLSDNNIFYPKYRMFDDQVFYTKAILAAKDISLIQKALYNYRIRKTSITYVYNNQHSDIMKSKFDIIKSLNLSDKKSNLKKNIYIHTITSCLYWYKRYVRQLPKIEKAFYDSIREVFLNLDLNYINSNLENINPETYKEFLLIRNNIYPIYKLKMILMHIFSLTYINQHTVLIIMGIKLSFRFNQKSKITKNDVRRKDAEG